MKKRMRRMAALALAGALIVGLSIPAAAFSFPSAYWPLQEAWSAAVSSQDVNATLSTAQRTYDLFRGQPLCKEICEILEPRCSQAAWCCELKGDLDGAILWRQRQLTYAQWLNDNVKSYQDTILNVNAQLNHLQREMEVYALVESPADVPYYGVKGEPVSGVYFGTVPEAGKYGDSSALLYVDFLNESMGYWLDYHTARDSVAHRALNQGGVVEVAWNFKESNAGLDEVLSADAYIAESLAELGSRNSTILLRVGAEMNCWTSLPDPQKYIQAFQKIAREARKHDNIALVFSPNDVSNRTVDYETYYPGDAYVDWIGVSTYKNTGTSGGSSSYTYSNTGYAGDAFTCTGIYGNDPLVVLQELTDLAKAHHKPMMISECGFGHMDKHTGTDQTAQAVDQMNKFYSYLPMVYPQVKAVFLFDLDLDISRYHYSLNANPTLAATYAQLVQSGAYLQSGQTKTRGYTRLSTVNERMSTLELATYAIFPGSGSATCQYYVDGVLKHTATAEPFRYSLNAADLTPGAHTITVKAGRGSFAKTVQRTFYVDGQGMVTGSDKLGMDLSTADSWAVGGILNARAQKLLTPRTQSNFRGSITRLQFAELAVNLIETATGKTLPTGNQSFQDTSDPVALKAAAAGVANGTGEGSFSPNAPITRQEICVMLNQVIRIVDEANGTATLKNLDTALNSSFQDTDQVAGWAVESMARLTNNGLMSGKGNGILAPRSNTSVQEGITLILALNQNWI